MTPVPYTCKFCKQPGTAKYDDSVAIDLSRWIPYLACNRCCTYNLKRIRIEDRMYNLCVALMRTHEGEAIALIRQKLEAVTKDYAALVCRHLNTNYTWDDDFVVQLTENPANVRKVCFHFRKLVFESIEVKQLIED